MALTIELSPKIEEQIREIAERHGMSPEIAAIQMMDFLLWLRTQVASDKEADLLKTLPARFPFALAHEFFHLAWHHIGDLPIPAPTPNDPTLALFAQWAAEDATDDPEELERRDAELTAFKTNMNANRIAAGEEPIYL